MTSLSASDEMVRGYLDGLEDDRDELPESTNHSQQYAHGWRNGRDDRKNKPRDFYHNLKATAEKLIEGNL
jgi:ribosome modulation factor